MNIGGFENESSTQGKLLGMIIDNSFKFVSHVRNLCKNASRKVHALARISPYMSVTNKQTITILNTFFVSQFSYFLYAWICYSKTLNNRIKKALWKIERCLCVIYNDKKSKFQKMLGVDKSVLIHYQYLQVLATEMYKVTKGYPRMFWQTISCPETSLITICAILLVLRCL